MEHPFRILKRIFGFVKVRFRGLKKNHNHLCTASALVNLYHHRKRLALMGASCARRAPKMRSPGQKARPTSVSHPATRQNRPAAVRRQLKFMLAQRFLRVNRG